MIEKGLKYTSELTVTDAVTAITVGSGDMPVLATPMMMALMENAAMLAVKDELPEGCYFGSYTLVEITLLLLVILPTIAVYKLTKEDKTMSKRDFFQANKDWLETKSKEEDVKALPKGISRCISVTSGNCTSLQRWAMASSLSLASLVDRRLSLKLNC